MRLHFEDGERELFAARLGLAEDADDAAIAAAAATWLASEETDTDTDADTDTDTNTDADIDAQDGVFVDASEYVRLKRTERQASRIAAAERQRDRDELIEEAIADGKFSPARRKHYKDRYDSDPDGTKALIARFTRNTVPLEERGENTQTDEVDASAYPTNWVPEVQERQSNESTANGRRTRVHTEG